MATGAVWYRLVTMTQEIIRSLGLTYDSTSLPAAQVYARKILNDSTTTLPFVMCALGGPETIEGGTFEDHEWTMPVLVATAFASNRDMTLDSDSLQWRQSIIETFDRQPRPEMAIGDVDVYSCEINTNPPVDMRHFHQSHLDVGSLLLLYKVTKNKNRGRHG